MTLRAAYLGELAARFLSQRRRGEVTRVFPKAVYLRTGDDFLLLLWGPLKSPMTINMAHGKSSSGYFKVGQPVGLKRNSIESEGVIIEAKDAKVYRSSLLAKRDVALPDRSALVKGVTMLKSMYDVSPHGPVLVADNSFASLVSGVLIPFSAGRGNEVFSLESYLGLVGRGGGFTPAGDDFVAGFIGTFNYFARCRHQRTITVPRVTLLSRTVPESGAIVYYSSMGHVDEGLGRLIQKSTSSRSVGFSDELLSVAARGHTSGVDMSLGVLLCEAMLADKEVDDGALAECVGVMREK